MTELKKIEKMSCRIKSYLLVLFLFIFASGFSISQENSVKLNITNRGVDNANFEISTNTEERVAIIILRESNIDAAIPDFAKIYVPITKIANPSGNNLSGEGNVVIYQGALNSEQFIASNLKHNTDYAIDVYFADDTEIVRSEKIFTISTLAQEPSKQSSNVIATIPKGGEIKVLFSKGDGEKRFLLLGENQQPSMPIDGIEYDANFNLETTAKINDYTYIINTDHNFEFTVKGLKNSTDYYLTVIEANGEGYKVNYMKISNNNTFKTTTPTDPPKNLMLVAEKKKRIKALWEKADGATNYQLDVATDKNFENKLDRYAGIAIGDIDQFIIVGIQKDTFYYVRLRALSNSGYSNYTKTEKIKIDSM